MSVVRIATRGSVQARTQAQSVADALQATHAGLTVELLFVETTGDQRQDVPLHTIGGQGVFVKEVQRAVLDGRAQLAVHSAKDLPSTPAEGLTIGAFCQRRSAADALVGRSLELLDQGATVATGSVRRRAQLAAVRPDLRFIELRGNIQTRLSKVPDDGAIVMAVAALEILELTELIAQELPVESFVPAVGQGCVAVECASDDEATLQLLAELDHGPTRDAVLIERGYLATLGSGCSLPVGAHVDGGELRAFLADPDTGKLVRREIVLADEPLVQAAELARARCNMLSAMPDPADGPGRLAGLTVVVTRPETPDDPLVELLAAAGARVLVMPLIEIVDQASATDLRSAIAPLTAGDWVIVASARAAQRVSGALAGSPANVAAIGATTASALPRVDLVPQIQSAEGLLAEFPAAPTHGGRVVIAQAVAGEPTLVSGTTTLGWKVTRIDTHFSRAVVPSAAQQLGVLQADVVIFTSGSQARAWVEVFGTATPAVVATMGRQTARNAEACGLKVDVIAADHTLPGVLRAVQEFVKP